MKLNKGQQLQVDELEKAAAQFVKAKPASKSADAKGVGASEICGELTKFIPILEKVKGLWFAGKKLKAAIDKLINLIETYCPIVE